MSEYIEREAVTAMLKRKCSPRVIAYLVDEICKIHAADVRPVVFCKDCMMRQYCKVAQYLGADGFCSNGEKREES
jgi:hypothetical protein